MSFAAAGLMSLPSCVYSVVQPLSNTPFCDKPFKMLRLTADFAGKCLPKIEWLFRGIVVCCSNKNTQHSKEKYRNYFTRSMSESGKVGDAAVRLVRYVLYGKEIVDFALSPGEKFRSVQVSLSIQQVSLVSKARAPIRREILNEVYGTDAIAQWFVDIPLQSGELLRQLPKAEFSFGMVCEFIASYFQNRESGKSPLESVKTIARAFDSGPPNRAQIAQIFYRSLFYAIKKSPLGQNYLAKRKQSFALKPLGLAQNASENAHWLTSQLIAKQAACLQEIECQFAIVGNPSSVRSFTKIAESDPLTFQKFSQFVNALKPGVYRVLLREFRLYVRYHYMAFIKLQTGNCFLFDPRIATLAVESSQSAKRLWERGRGYSYFEFTGMCIFQVEDVLVSAEHSDEEIDDKESVITESLL